MNKKVVCLGGGTGLSTMLRGLKKYTEELTAIVTVADNGGSSGILRKEMKMLPPGDIRNCLLALAETEPMMEKVFQYRFKDNFLEGQNLGNLFLAAMFDIFGSFEKAVEKANEVLAVKGKVLPVTMEDVQLCARHLDKTITVGESEIVIASKLNRNPIESVSLKPENPVANPKAIEAILSADLVVLGPGSLYTSIVPNVLVHGISEAVNNTAAKVIYVSNIMTQPGETDGYTLKGHLRVIEEYLGKDRIDFLVVNDKPIDEKLLVLYEEDGAKQVIVDLVSKNHLRVIRTPLIDRYDEHQYIRHDPDLLAQVIMKLM